MSQIFSNNAATVLASPKAAGATTMVVQAGTGARFPTLAGGDFFELTLFKIVDGLEASYEIVKVTARSIDTFTIVGAQQGTTPTAFGVGDQVSLRVTAGWLNKATTDIESKAPSANPTFTGVASTPTANPQINSTEIANTAWVNRRGVAFQSAGGIGLNTGTTALSQQDLGHWLQFNQPNAVLVVGTGFDTPTYSGTTFTVRAAYAGIVQFPGIGVVWPDGVGLFPTYDMQAGEVATFANNAAGWYVVSTGLTPRAAAGIYAPKNSPTFTGTVGGITKAMVGLGNVDNTSDANKPVSTAQGAALDLKAPIANPTFTGTVGGITKTMIGLGNVDNTSDANKPVSTAQGAALDLKAPIANPTFTGTVSGITKGMVGLSNVDNTSDTNKPVSAAQGAALDLKAPITNPTFTGTVSGITKGMVGLSNVDNTSDTNKPVSAAQGAALDLKAPIANPTFTGTVGGITKTMIGLGNVDNTSDANKPVSTAQGAALDLKAPTDNPTFTDLATINTTRTTKLSLRSAGVVRGGVGADASFCLRVSNASDSAYVLDLDNSGVMALPGGLVTAGLRPNVDNTVPGGTAAFRFTAMYAATGTINTSDATMKCDLRGLTASEIAAAKDIARAIGIYRWIEAVESKGDAAREHIGPTVQRVISIMQSHGLDPFNYGFICFDEWPRSTIDHEAVEAQPSTPTSPAVEAREAYTEVVVEAGSRYAFRYDELAMFIAAGQEARLAALGV